MKRKLGSVFLAAIITYLMVIPSYAVEYSENNFEELSEEEIRNSIELNCDSFNIRFDGNDNNTTLMDSHEINSFNEETETDILTKNSKRSAVAAEFIKSLNLSEKGYESIETFCLNELEYYGKMEEAELISYTVHVPKESSSGTRASAPPKGYTFFGSFGGRDFYFYYPSTLKLKTNVQKTQSQSTLQKWVNGSTNLLMAYANIKISVPWTIFQTIIGTPSNYKVTVGAHLEHYCNVNIHTRGIYTLYANGTYQMLTSQQFGDVYPYNVFHPADSPKYQGSYNHDFGYKGQVFSPKYKKSVSALCQEAWEIYNGAYSPDNHDKILLTSYSGFFQ